MMNEAYENQDLSGAVFHNVNLSKAKFKDVNLESATIRNANLHNFYIEDAYIQGMTVFGFDVYQLISDEMDRRDPERMCLRVSDPYDPECIRAVYAHLEEVRRGFYATLRAADPQRLIARPAPEEWSALETVRHLLYAEDLFLNRRILGNSEPWCPLGLLPDFLVSDPAYVGVGSQPSSDLEEILAAWTALHARLQAFVAGVTVEQLKAPLRDLAYGEGVIADVLRGMPIHDLTHIRQAEATLKVGEEKIAVIESR
jgi:hypothetical protein